MVTSARYSSGFISPEKPGRCACGQARCARNHQDSTMPIVTAMSDIR